MNSSENLNELAAALAKAQGAMRGALKDSANPFFKSKYADLESVWDACRKHLTENGLSVIQMGGLAGPISADAVPILITRLLHSSGQWIEGMMPIKAKDDGPQAQGSGITYARRYGLAAMVGVYQTDDDAEAAQGRTEGYTANPRPPHEYKVDQEVREEWVDAIRRNLKDPAKLLGIHEELNSDETMYPAVVDRLNTAEKKAFKDGIVTARKIAKDAAVPF